MLKNIVFSLLAVSTPAEIQEDKPFYFRSYENASPTIKQYRIAGAFGLNKTSFFLSMDFYSGKWHIEIMEANKPVRKLTLNEEYSSIPVNRIVVTTDGSDKNLLVIIPFGNPHSECFLNGKDVYSNIIIQGTGQIGLEHFPQCSLETTDLPVKKLNSAAEIGPPPKLR